MSDPMDDELRSLIALEKDAWSEPGDARTRLESKLGPIFAAHAAVAVGAAVGAAAGAGGTGAEGAGAVGNAVSVAEGAGATGDAASGIDTAIAGATQGGHAAVGTAARVVGMAGRAFRWPALAVAVSGGAALGSATTAAVLRATADPPPARIEVRYVDRVVEVEKGRDAGASVDVSDLPLAPVPSPSLSPTPATAPASATATESGMSDQDLVRERRLIDTARSALARRDATSALAALDEHARAFPRGQLVEMREALAVQALVQAGKSDEARARATRFHRRYRGSIYESVVDGALSSIP